MNKVQIKDRCCDFCGITDWHDDDCYYLATDPIARLKKALLEFAGDEHTNRDNEGVSLWNYVRNAVDVPRCPLPLIR